MREGAVALYLRHDDAVIRENVALARGHALDVVGIAPPGGEPLGARTNAELMMATITPARRSFTPKVMPSPAGTSELAKRGSA